MALEKPEKTKRIKGKKTYKSGITGKCFLISAIAIIASLFQILHGAKSVSLYSSIGYVFSVECILFGYIPLVFGILIFLIVGITFFMNINQSVTITYSSFLYESMRMKFTEKWDQISYRPPKMGSLIYKSFTIRKGNEQITVNSLFFPNFDKLVNTLRLAREGNLNAFKDDSEV